VQVALLSGAWAKWQTTGKPDPSGAAARADPFQGFRDVRSAERTEVNSMVRKPQDIETAYEGAAALEDRFWSRAQHDLDERLDLAPDRGMHDEQLLAVGVELVA
jgi:hypothetical protein